MSPYNIPTFWLFPLNGLDFIFFLPKHTSRIENISRIKRCDNSGLSLHFKPKLQSVVCIFLLPGYISYKSTLAKEKRHIRLSRSIVTWFFSSENQYTCETITAKTHLCSLRSKRVTRKTNHSKQNSKWRQEQKSATLSKNPI